MEVMELRRRFVVTLSGALRLPTWTRRKEGGVSDFITSYKKIDKVLEAQILSSCLRKHHETFGHSFSIFIFGCVRIAAQLTIRRLQLVQVAPRHLASNNSSITGTVKPRGKN